jgi:ABC-type bacteriocin/lantibiotic exporter with double-glycine peptidase domain
MVEAPAPLTSDLAKTTASFLALHGVEAHRQRLTESLADDPSIERIASELFMHGLDARPVEVTRRDLPLLRTPTLVCFADGRAHVVLEVLKNALRVAGTGGSSALVSTREDAIYPLRALEVAERPPDTASFLRRFFLVFSRERTNLLRMLSLSLLVLGFNLATPLLTRQVLDRALPDGSRNLLALIALAMPVLALHRTWLELLRAGVLRQLEARVVSNLLAGMIKHVVHLPFLEQQRRPPHELAFTVSATETLAQQYGRSILSPLLDVLSAAAYLVWLALVLPQVAAVACAMSLLVLALSAFTARKLARLTRMRVPASARQGGFLYETLAGVMTVKSLGAERTCGRRWLERLVDERRLDLDSLDAQLFHQTMLRLLTRATSLAMFAWGAHACLHGDLTLGAFLSAAMYADGLMGASTRLGGTGVQLWGSRSLLERVDDVLSVSENRHALDRHALKTPSDHAITLDDVWFRHAPHARWVVQGEALRVKRGEVLSLRSPSGSGKTTLLRLMAGLYEPERGHVRVEGRDPGEVRHLITYLPQQAHLLEGSILHNLRMLSGAPIERVLKASVDTGLFEWVGSLPMGFETLISAGGYNVSGGQRQWIAITAAVASDRPIVLLDEAMCHIDRPRRARLARGDLFHGKTVVHVTHEEDEVLG